MLVNYISLIQLQFERGEIKMGLFDFLGKKVTDSRFATVVGTFDEKTCFLNLAIHIAVSYIANTLSKCEIKVFDDGKEVKNEMYYKLNISPNANQNGSQFMNAIIENYFYDGEALVIENNKNFYVCDSFATEKEVFKPNKFTSLVIEDTLTSLERYSTDCFHFKLDNKNIKQIVELVYAEYGKLISASIQNYRRKNGRKYKLNIENYQAGNSEFLKLYDSFIKNQLKSFLENDNAIYPQFKGFNLEEFKQDGNINSASNSDIISMRKDTFEIVAQAFKIPLSMLMGNINNMNEIVKVYLTTCIDPIADMISEELTRKTSTFTRWKKGDKIKVDTSNINHVDIFDVGDYVDKMISSGTLSIDEVREKLDFEKLNTEFSSKHFITKNFTDLKEGDIQNE